MAWLRYRLAVIAAGGLLFMLAALSVVLAIDWTKVNEEATWADAIVWSAAIGYMADLVTVVGISTMVVGLLQHFYQRLPETIVREAIRDLHDENPAKSVEARMKLLSHPEQAVQALHEYVTFLMETDAPDDMPVALRVFLRIAYRYGGGWWSQAECAAQGHLQNYLEWAAEAGHLELTKLLLDGGVTADMADDQGWTPAYRAALHGHRAVAVLLLEHESIEFWDALRQWIRALDIEKRSLEETQGEEVGELKAEIEDKRRQMQTLIAVYETGRDGSSMGGSTPLRTAAREGHTDIAKILLDDMEADVNAQDGAGWTPLHWAANNGHRDVVGLLLEREAKVDGQNSDDWTSLHLAAQGGHCGVAELLLERGADINARTTAGWTPLHWATRNDHREVAELLLERGAEANAQDSSGQTPLHRAAARGHREVAELLREWGAEE